MDESPHQLSFLQLVNDVQPTNGVEFCQNYLNGSASEMSKAVSSPVPAWQGLLVYSIYKPLANVFYQKHMPYYCYL